MELRPYQNEAVRELYKYYRENDPSRGAVVVMPTGTGKTLVIRQLCHDVVTHRKNRVVVLAHRKELLSQAEAKLDGNVSVYSASLGRKCLQGDVVLGQIQSIYKLANEVGAVDLVIVDECHLVTLDEDGMFAKFLGDMRLVNPQVRFCGLTATPYRMKEGEICSEAGPWHDVAYEYDIRRAVTEGYLTPLVSTAPACGVSHEGLHVRAGEYITSEVEERVDVIVEEACKDILAKTQDRSAVLVFCVSRKHARQVAEKLGGDCILGDMEMKDRDDTIRAFNAGWIKYLVNVDVLTTGFDCPRVDAIAMLRPTLSRGLFVQIAGRGMRLFPGKEHCGFLDYGGNIAKHGPIDAPYKKPRKIWHKDSTDKESVLAVEWMCPECGRINDNGFSQCAACNYVRSRPVRHEVRAANEAIMQAAGISPIKREWESVQKVEYYVHIPRDANKQKSMRVEYITDGWRRVSEWVCVNHTGYARARAEAWWALRSNEPFPESVDHAVQLAKFGCLADTLQIHVDKTGDYDRILDCTLGAKPPALPSDDADWCRDLRAVLEVGTLDDDDLPF